jgi:2-(3-amino-3-carboxypropyl)histidine synthase
MSCDYDLEVGRIVSEIRRENPRIVGLQFPEGLKKYAVDVASEIESKTDAKVIVLVDPTYGACDLKEEQAKKLGVDLLVHFGHTEFKKS